MIKYVAMDVESGGLTTDCSLLTAYLGIFDRDFNQLNELEFAVKPDNGIYHVTARALEVNKIDLIKHDASAISMSLAGHKLREFLIPHSDNGKNKLTPLGHNVPFDVKFLGDTVLNKKTLDNYMTYRVFDTGVLAAVLKHLGRLPEALPGSLESLVTHYGITPDAFHTAKGDTLMAVAVAKAMLNDLS